MHAARYLIAAATFACAWLLAPPSAAVSISLLVVIGALLDVQRFPEASDAHRERLEAMWEMTGEAFAVVNPNGRIDEASAGFARFFGRERATVRGIAVSELSPESELSRVIADAAREGRDVAQLALRNGAGERVPVDLALRPSGSGTFLVALRPTVPAAPPVAPAKADEGNAQSAALVATIERAAHDLNNILSAISGNLDLARQDVGPSHAARESLDEILSATRRARGVAAALMQASPRRLRATSSDAPAGDAKRPVANGPAENAAAGQPGKLLLYVDDDEPLTDIVGRLLSRKGHRVAGHTDASRAIADFKSRADEFALVVTDLNLPNASGLDVAREVRAVRPDLPVVLVSGFFRAEEIEAARAAGIAETLLKASSAHEFAADIARYLTR